MAFCTQCGKKLEPNIRFCSACGKAVRDVVATPPPLPSHWQAQAPPPPPAMPAPQPTRPPVQTKPPRRRGCGCPLLVIVLIAACAVGIYYLEKTWPGWWRFGRSGPDIREVENIIKGLQGTGPGPVYEDSWQFSTPKPGTVIASANVGASGGRVEAPNKVSVSFPPGCIADEQPIVIRDCSTGMGDAPIYFIETESRKPLTLSRPAGVTLTIPYGADTNGIEPMQELMSGIFASVPGQYDRATRQLTFEVDHFSGLSWARLQKSAYGIGATAIVLVIVCGWSAPISLSGYLMIGAVSTVVGAPVVAPAIQMAIQEAGLKESISVPGVDIFWSNEGQHAVPEETDDDLFEEPLVATLLFDQYGRLVKTSDLSQDECAEKFPDLIAREVPRSILVLAWELGRVHMYYKKAGYNPPDRIPVVVRADLDVNREGGANYGEWDTGAVGQLGYLRLMSAYVTSKAGETSAKRRSTITHEYWHAVAEFNSDFKYPYKWVDEALATTFESEVFPGCFSLGDARKWNTVFRVLGIGFVQPGADDTGGKEDPIKRGYSLWPWGKYLLHKHGHDMVKRFINGEFSDDELAGYFDGFAECLMSSQSRLPVDAPQVPPVYTSKQHTEFKVPTGWGDLHLVEGYSGTTGMGQVKLKGMNTPRPLSLRVFAFVPTEPPVVEKTQELPSLVIRRREPDEKERIAVMRSIKSPDYAPSGLLGSGAGGVVFKGGMFKKGTLPDPGVAVALVNTGVQEPQARPSWNPNNPVLIYYLVPPSDPKVEKMGSSVEDPNAPVRYKISWTQPDYGSMKPADCLNGYRVIVKDINGKIIPVMETLLSPGMSSQEVELRPDYEIYGLASEDGGMRDAKGQLLLSVVCPLKGSDIMEYLLPASVLPLDLKEISREQDNYGEAGATIDIATQELEGPPVPREDPSDPNPYPDVNPVLLPMGQGDDYEWQQKAKAVQEWVERQSRKPRKKQLAPRLVVQRATPALLSSVVFKLVVARSEQEASLLTRQSEGTYRTDDSARKLVILWEKGDLIVALSCDPAYGDMQLLDTLKPIVDQHIDSVNARKKP